MCFPEGADHESFVGHTQDIEVLDYFSDTRRVLSFANGAAILHTYQKWLQNKVRKQTSGASLGGAPTSEQGEGRSLPMVDGAMSDGEKYASCFTRASLPRCIARKRDVWLQRATDAALFFKKIVFLNTIACCTRMVTDKEITHGEF